MRFGEGGVGSLRGFGMREIGLGWPGFFQRSAGAGAGSKGFLSLALAGVSRSRHNHLSPDLVNGGASRLRHNHLLLGSKNNCAVPLGAVPLGMGFGYSAGTDGVLDWLEHKTLLRK